MRGFRTSSIFTVCLLIGMFAGVCHGAANDAPTSGSWTPYVQIVPDMNFWRIGKLPERDSISLTQWRGGEWRIRSENGIYIIEQPDWRGTSPTTGSARAWVAVFGLDPSREVPGDLDLVTYYLVDFTMGPKKKYSLGNPLVSYLHPMTDPRVKKYIYLTKELRSRWDRDAPLLTPGTPATHPTSVTAALLDISRSMMADSPNDFFLRYFYVDALIASGDSVGLAKEMEFWRTNIKSLPQTSILRYAFKRFEWTLHALQLSRSNQNSYDFLTAAISEKSNMDLGTRFRALPQILRYEEYACPWQPSLANNIYYLPVQINAKVFSTGVEMFLLQGDRKKALETATSVYHLGQLLSQNDTLINRYMGIAMRGIGAQSLGLYVLNGCERPGEVEEAWRKLEWLNAREKPQGTRDMFSLEQVSVYMNEPEWNKDSMIGPNLREALTRQGVADTRFQLVRMAAGARHYFLRTGGFSKSIGEFNLPTSGTITPRDPFGEGPLRSVENPKGLVCYGVGPNQKDEGGTITYDPTNGSVSPGDVVLEVPRERKYPFPSGGVRAANRDDLLRQFPKGLPPDLFADTKNKPLGVTNTSPVCVHSFGPDVNEGAAVRLGDSYVPEVEYDPTNGTISKGDIFITVPKP